MPLSGHQIKCNTAELGNGRKRGVRHTLGTSKIQVLDFSKKTITLYSDHNPIVFLTESTPKSAKLMRWALAIQEFDVKFCYRKGSLNGAADCLSRNVGSGDDGSSPSAS